MGWGGIPKDMRKWVAVRGIWDLSGPVGAYGVYKWRLYVVKDIRKATLYRKQGIR